MVMVEGNTRGGKTNTDFSCGSLEKFRVCWISQNVMPSTKVNRENRFMKPTPINLDFFCLNDGNYSFGIKSKISYL